MTEPVTVSKAHTTAELLAELREKLELAKEPGGEKAAAKRDKKGIASARARVHELLDPGSFLETGALARTPGDPNALFGDGVVTGRGTLNGRLVAGGDQGYSFVTGPDVSQEGTGEDVSLDELGGADAQARYGNLPQVVESEAAAFQYVRDFLSFLPSNCFDRAPIVNPGLEPEI